MIYGLVVYAGVDTKLFLNQQPPPSKFSTVERVLNKFILGIFLFQMFVCLVNAVLSGFFQDNTAQNIPYLGENNYTTPGPSLSICAYPLQCMDSAISSLTLCCSTP